MRAFLIPTTRSLIDAVAGLLEAGGRDYSSSLVVFPGKRPSHFLRKALAKREGSSFIPPRILSMDGFIDTLYGERMGLDGRRLEAIDAISILYDIHTNSVDRLGTANFLAPDAFFPLGMKIYHDLEELSIEGVPPSAVKEIDTFAEETIPAPMAKRLQTLSHFYETFYRIVDEKKYSTRSSRYRAVAAAAERLELEPFGKVFLAGFFALTESEKRIFRSFREKEGIFLLIQDGPGMEGGLSDLGIPLENDDGRPFDPVHPSTSSGRTDKGLTVRGEPVEPWTMDDGRPTSSGPTIEGGIVRGEPVEPVTKGEERKDGPPADPAVHCYKSPDGHGQIFGLGRLLKEKIDHGEKLDEKTVIVLPSPEALFPVFHQVLGLLRPGGYNVSLGYPLQRTPIFSLFRHLMELIVSADESRLYIPHYLKFILHPYIKNIYFRGRADLTRMLFHAIEEALTGKKTRKFQSLTEIEEDETIVQLIKDRILDGEPGISLNMMKDHLRTIHLNTIGRMRSFKNVGHFADELKAVMEYIYRESTARLHPFFYPYAESFAAHLDLLSRSLMNEVRFEQAGSYFNLFKKYLAAGYTPFSGTPLKGVQVLGFLETRNLKFDKVFFLDANEGVIPETKREDSLLPVKARALLRLPTHLDREKLMAHSFELLIQGAQEAHLFYVENDEKERSRFVERLLWERQKKERKRDDRSYVKTIQYGITLREKNPRPIEKSEEMVQFLKHYPFSASSLDTYLSCPLKFYYERVLGLREKEMVSEEIEGEEIGSFVHEVLFDYFKGKVGRSLCEKDLDPGEMEKVVHDHFKARYETDPTGEAYLLRRQIEKHLKDYLKDYEAPRCRAGTLRIVGLEQRLDVVKDSFKLNARLDRIEEREGRIAIVDYKTSANRNYLSINFNKLDPGNRSSWSEAIHTVQLPFYLIAYSAVIGEKPEHMNSLFLLLGRSKIDSSIELPLFKDGKESAERFEILRALIFNLLQEIVDRGTPFMPAAGSKNRCVYCPYGDVCSH